MPELPEVETVRNVLKLWVKGKSIKSSSIFYDKVLENIVFYDFKIKIIKRGSIALAIRYEFDSSRVYLMANSIGSQRIKGGTIYEERI